MRRAKPLAGLAALALLVAACGGSPPGWTYAPAPPPTPVPSVEASASVAPSASAADAFVSAAALAFEQPEVAVPADRAFTLEFANNDAGVQHNVEIKDDAGASIFRGALVTGVETVVYDVTELEAGQYPFICTVHPTMTGTLVAS